MLAMRRRFLLLLAAFATLAAFADNRTLVRGEYWFDDQQNSRVSVSIAADGRMDFMADASALAEGLHRLNYHALDSEGNWSALQTWIFFRVAANQATGTNAIEYWIDEGTHNTHTIAEGEMTAFIVDASAASEGLHRLSYRVKNSELHHSAVQTWLFYRAMPKNTVENATLVYWFDDGQQQTAAIDGQEVSFLADASALAEGLHRFSYNISYNDNQLSDTHTWTFYKVSNAPRATALKWYRVWWNNHEDKAIEVQLPDGTSEYLYEETLAVPEYARGDAYSHNSKARFHLVFCDNQGQLSPVESAEVPYPDIYPPHTTLTANLQADSVSLSWLANKDNVRDYNVYYSENDQPYILWLPNTTRTEAVFRGQRGTAYRFLVIARDDKGNYEAMEESKAVRVEF